MIALDKIGIGNNVLTFVCLVFLDQFLDPVHNVAAQAKAGAVLCQGVQVRFMEWE